MMKEICPNYNHRKIKETIQVRFCSTPIFTGGKNAIIRPNLGSPNNFNGHII